MKTDRDKFLTPDECRTLIGLVKSEGSLRDYVLLLLGMNAALRVGELVRIRVADLKESEGYISVPTLKRLSASEKKEKRDLRKVGGHWKKDLLKRGELPKLYLEVPLAGDVFKEIGDYRRKYGIVDGWLFPGKGGLHITSRQAERIFKHWVIRSGLSGNVSIHALRHARGVDLREKGLEFEEIKEILRHESLTSTMVYQHLTPSARARMRDRIGTLGIQGKQ